MHQPIPITGRGPGGRCSCHGISCEWPKAPAWSQLRSPQQSVAWRGARGGGGGGQASSPVWSFALRMRSVSGLRADVSLYSGYTLLPISRTTTCTQPSMPSCSDCHDSDLCSQHRLCFDATGAHRPPWPRTKRETSMLPHFHRWGLWLQPRCSSRFVGSPIMAVDCSTGDVLELYLLLCH